MPIIAPDIAGNMKKIGREAPGSAFDAPGRRAPIEDPAVTSVLRRYVQVRKDGQEKPSTGITTEAGFAQ
jgi:hypothetical protein